MLIYFKVNKLQKIRPFKIMIHKIKIKIIKHKN